MPPRFAKKQGSMSLEQPEESLSSNNLGTEIWETNNSDLCAKDSDSSGCSRLMLPCFLAKRGGIFEARGLLFNGT
ncbi:hypothetical protein CRUP_023210 [Coryphaenoides rupestris]|nr:hypothetical protein CRUP_023210 [Coryphaenoides rupestris]